MALADSGITDPYELRSRICFTLASPSAETPVYHLHIRGSMERLELLIWNRSGEPVPTLRLKPSSRRGAASNTRDAKVDRLDILPKIVRANSGRQTGSP